MVIVLPVALVALVVTAAVAAVGVRAAARSMQRQAAADRDAAVRAAVEAVTASVAATSATERAATVQAAVDTVVQVAGEKFDDQRGAATRELDLRSQTIAEQVSGLNQSFAQQLTGMHAELTRVSDLVGELQRDRLAQHGQVVESIEQAARQTASLSEVTRGLREVLASSRVRGQWGERMADDVLRSAGLVEGINYLRQVQLPGGTRPDVTFLLPHERVLHMDVKFPLENYVKYLEAASAGGDRAGADAFRRQFTKDVRQRVKEVTTRDYVDTETTVGYVLLFIPNEAVYSFLHENDPDLVDAALGQGVVLCSPFTLFAVLGVVRQAVETVQLQRTSDEILQCLGRFSTQWTKFSDSLDQLGRRFESAQKAYDDLAGTRRRVLQRSLDEVDRLREARGAALPAVAALARPPASSADDDERHAGADDGDDDDGDDDLGPVARAAGAEHDVAPPTSPPGPRVPRLRPIRGRS
jgi:DNA recombination protein RmuC